MICPIFTEWYLWHLPKRLPWRERLAGLGGQLKQEPFELVQDAHVLASELYRSLRGS